jgi:hypothetical protein
MSDTDDADRQWLVKSMRGQLWVIPFNAGFTSQLTAAGRFSQSQAEEIADAYNRADSRFQVVLAPEFSEAKKRAN